MQLSILDYQVYSNKVKIVVDLNNGTHQPPFHQPLPHPLLLPMDNITDQ